MEATIRFATALDSGDIVSLWMGADAEPTHTDDVDSVGRLIAHDPEAMILAVDGGAVVGSVIAGWDGWRGSIYRMVVAPSHRRTGLGTRLLEAAEQRLQARGAMRLQAIVVETDPRAAAFWRSSGWEQQAERLRFVRG